MQPFLAKQPFCDFTIAMPRQPTIEGPHHQHEASPALEGKNKRRRARPAAVDRAPKPFSGLQTKIRIDVERQFDGNRRALLR